jgi:uncharacterized protein (DUF58 family)
MPSRKPRRRKRHVYFRLTLGGWVFVAASILVGVVAINSRLALLFVLFGGMLGALHVSAALSRRMIAAVQVQRSLPKRCWQNQPVGLSYRLRSARGGGACLDLRVEELPAGAAGAPATYCAHLPARRGLWARGVLRPGRRGRLRLRTFRLSTGFPFGLVSASRRFEAEASLIVWPARGRLRRPLLRGGSAESSASAPSLIAGGKDEFYGLREYRPGDNPRWIHWRRSASRPEPVVREMSRPRPETLWVVLDTHLGDAAPAARERRERAIRFAATLIDDALADGYRVGAALAYARGPVAVAPTGRPRQRQRLLDALADVDDNTEWALGETVSRLRPARLGHAHVVVVALSDEAAAVEPLRRVSRACRDLTVVTSDRLDEVFRDPLAGGGAVGEGA